MWKKTIFLLSFILSSYAGENKEVFIPDAQGNLTQEVTTDTSKTTKSPLTLSYQGAFLKMMLSFGAVILLLFVSFWALKKLVRHRKHSPEKLMHIIERKVLSPKTILYLIEIDNERVVIAESQLHIKKIQSLAQIEDDSKFLKEE
jgi:flagellar biogenesis protein FliO